MLFKTPRADPMTEIHLGMDADILLDAEPVPLVVTDVLAVSADGQESAQGLDVRHGLLQFLDQPFPLLFRLFPLGDVIEQARFLIVDPAHPFGGDSIKDRHDQQERQPQQLPFLQSPIGQ